MRLSILLLTIFYVNFYHCTSINRMVEIYGATDNYTDQYMIYNDWNLCLGNCWKDNWCTMAYWNAQIETCWYFKYDKVGSVKKLDGSSEEKINMESNSCPSSNPLFIKAFFSTISNYKKYVTTISYVKSTTSFKFTYKTVPYCPDGTKQFKRGSVDVCIGLKSVDKAITWYEASAMCKTDGGMSLTGPFDSAEFNYMNNEMIKYRVGFWLDGISRNSVKKFEMEDNTHNGVSAYPWFPGKPDGSIKGCCVYFPYQNLVDDTM